MLNRIARLAIAGVLLAAAATAVHGTQDVPTPESWFTPVKPFQVVENIYYVGTEDLASYLVTGTSGHILVDTGHERSAGPVVQGIRALGFRVEDVRVLLTTQAHFDHVGAHARLKALSGAQVMASEADASVIARGGKGDYHLGPAYYFPPVRVDRVVRDGEVVRVGKVALTARLTPGHTRGTTTWTTTVGSGAGRRFVVIAGSTTVLDGVRLVGNEAYPHIAEDFQRSFTILEGLQPDVFLAAHASAVGGVDRIGKAGLAEYREYVARSRQAFEEELAKQRH